MSVAMHLPAVVPLKDERLNQPSHWLRQAGRLAHWVEQQGYQAYDPGDGQRSWVGGWTLGHPWAERLLTAGVLRSPWNVRPLLGIRPHTSTKGMGYMAWGYLLRYRCRQDPADAIKARSCLQWLIEHRATSPTGYAWGNDFNFTTRAGRIPRGEPTIVWTSLIGQAFLEGFRVLGDVEYLHATHEVCRWIASLPRQLTRHGSCLSYVPSRQVSIHNANMLGAALLAEVGQGAAHESWMDLAREAMRYSLGHQGDDGSWAYAQGHQYQWIDNFHTGYNLDSLHRYLEAVGEADVSGCEKHALELGLKYFLEHFFLPSGQPRYEVRRTWPMDIQCAAQSIDTLTLLRRWSPLAFPLACRVADWTLLHMQDPQGYFYYRKHRFWVNKTAMFHWGQGTMFKALSHLALATELEKPSSLMNIRSGAQA